MATYNKGLGELIPPSFGLERYEHSKSSDPTTWYLNIKNRLGINEYIGSQRFKEHISARDKGELPLEKELQSYMELNEANIKNGFVPDRMWVEEAGDLVVVNPLYVSDVKRITKQLEEAAERGTDIPEYAGVSDHEFSFAKVNIFSPEEIAVEHFRKWFREQKEKKYAVTSAVLRRWHDKQVIPYIDLVQWHALRGNRLTAYQIAQILFPNETSRNPVDIIYKSTEKFASEILERETSRALYIQGLAGNWKEKS